MLSAFEQDSDVVIDADGLMAADLSLVQLIEAMRKSADRRGRSLALSAPASGGLRAVLDRGGFIAGDSTGSSSFWLQGAVTQ